MKKNTLNRKKARVFQNCAMFEIQLLSEGNETYLDGIPGPVAIGSKKWREKLELDFFCRAARD